MVTRKKIQDKINSLEKLRLDPLVKKDKLEKKLNNLKSILNKTLI